MESRVGEAEWDVLGVGEVLEGGGKWVKGEWACESVGLGLGCMGDLTEDLVRWVLRCQSLCR